MFYPKIIIDINNYNRGCNTCGKSITLVPEQGGCSCHSAQIPSPNSPCVDCDTKCIDPLYTDCIFYTAGDIPQLGIVKDDLLTKIIITLAAEIIALKQRVTVLEG